MLFDFMVDIVNLLVYGTLKQGGRLHHIIENCPFLGDSVVCDHKLISLGFCPGLVPCEGAESHGEVYEIDDPDLIRRLDLIEGAYTRTKFEKFEAYVLKPIYRVLDHKNNIRFIEEANYYEWVNS